jgi:regulator of cell morphogenesis and NO signaling
MKITENTTVGDIAGALPESVRVFQRFDIDFCCGGKTPLTQVCRERGLDVAEIADAIEEAGAVSRDDRDWANESLGRLIDHILTAYHAPLREELPRLRALSSKVAQVHGARAWQLRRLDAALGELSAELVAHMRKEEEVLFPAIRRLESGKGSSAIPLAVPIAVMEQEHEHAGRLLAEIRALTDGFSVPEWGCATVRAVYHGLAELEAAMHVHIHLENNVLFPRAVDLTNARVGA